MLPAQVLPTIFGTKKGKIANNIKVIMVEAGGIEPPSEGLQHKAATCVVCVFESQTRSAHRQAFHAPAPLCNPSAQEAKTAGCAHLCLTPVTDADERASAGRGCSRQPVRKNNRRHLFFFCLFYEGADLGMLLVPQLPPSNPLRPRGVFALFRCVAAVMKITIVLMHGEVKRSESMPLQSFHRECGR